MTDQAQTLPAHDSLVGLIEEEANNALRLCLLRLLHGSKAHNVPARQARRDGQPSASD